jgi:pilus assembly protein CpaE
MLKSSETREVMVIGRSAEAVKNLTNRLQDVSGIHCRARVTDSTPLNTLIESGPRPDVLLVSCDDQHLQDLESLAAMDPWDRPPVIACGHLTSNEANRAVVRAGAFDLLSATPSQDELMTALKRVNNNRNNHNGDQPALADVTTLIGAAGGAGATFITANLAHLTASISEQRTVVVDLDWLYTPIAAALGLKPDRGLIEAVQNSQSLDTVALEGYLAHHASGLNLLAAPQASSIQGDVDPDGYRRVLQLLRRGQEQIFIEGSRRLDSLTTVSLAESTHVCLVVEQSVAQLQNATRLHSLLLDQMGLPEERLIVVVNRYSKHASLQPDLIAKTLGIEDPLLIPNRYELALESFDAAVPLLEMEPHSDLIRALKRLACRLGCIESPAPAGLLQRTLSALPWRHA